MRDTSQAAQRYFERLRGPGHPAIKYSDETIRTVIAMKRSGSSNADIRAATGLTVRHTNEVYKGTSRGYLQDSTSPDIRNLIASCLDVVAAIRSARVSRGWTRHQLSYAVGVYESTVWGWETRRQQPSAIAVRRVADALGMSVEDLLGVVPTTPFTGTEGQ